MTATTISATVAPAAATSRRSRLLVEGARDITPLAVGVMPFGLAIGAAMASTDMPPAAALASGPLILAGAAQLTTIEMLDSGVAPAIIVASALMINARILLYGAGLAPWFRGESLGRRLLLALPVIDQLYLTCVPRFERGDLDRVGRQVYWAGAAGFLVGCWIASQAAAFAAGATIPPAVGLHLAAPLALAGLLAKSIPNAKARSAAVAAAITSVMAAAAPFHSAVLIGIVVGITAGAAGGRADRTAAESEEVGS